jgi:hypothetical protein
MLVPTSTSPCRRRPPRHPHRRSFATTRCSTASAITDERELFDPLTGVTGVYQRQLAFLSR